ncbi:MAG: hypothetical protein AAGC46_05120 [Solirubrobacteraceae bacterium]|nr:hypothetical protein [Patulibacter sp.]
MTTAAPDQLTVVSVRPFGADDLLEALRRTPLHGFDGAQPYLGAELELVTVDPGTLAPAQRYVLSEGVCRAHALRAALAPHGIDPFALDGGVWITTADEPDIETPLLPPIVELSHEPDGRVVPLVNDGLHRVYAAREVGALLTVVRATGVPTEYPYYALALERGWDDVVALDELPDGFQKKTYRQPTGYKALFRDFNAVYPGIQQARKATNPAHLRA